ncbi:MAG: PAS domain S-box protein [Gammaproteobacteria bacterium]
MPDPDLATPTAVHLQQFEAQFKQLFEAAPDAVLVSDQTGRIVLVNAMVSRMFGYDPGELIGAPIEALVPERKRATHVADRAGYYHEPRSRYMGQGIELSALRKDGTEIDVEISLVPMELEEGTRLVVSAVRDISDRKRAERALREREELLSALLDSSPAVIYIKDATGRYLKANRRFQELVHLDSGTIVGKTDRELFNPARAAVFSLHDREVLSTGEAREFDEAAVGDDGERIYLSSKFPLRDAGGQSYALCGILTDITDRKHMEEALERQARDLERSNAELEQFAYVASHDLQEPLRMVASYAQLLARRYGGQLDDDGKDFIEFMVDGARRMQDLINALLAFSRVGTRGKPLVATDINAVVSDVLANLQTAINEADAEITVAKDMPTVNADTTQLGQVFQNLVSNALKFHAAPPPRVDISFQRLDSEVEFVVRDNGIGIEPQYAERIFLLFQRLHTKQDYPGTGIGLAICKKIIERHGGRIWVESTPGQGSAFHFTIPLRAGEGQSGQ